MNNTKVLIVAASFLHNMAILVPEDVPQDKYFAANAGDPEDPEPVLRWMIIWQKFCWKYRKTKCKKFLLNS